MCLALSVSTSDPDRAVPEISMQTTILTVALIEQMAIKQLVRDVLAAGLLVTVNNGDDEDEISVCGAEAAILSVMHEAGCDELYLMRPYSGELSEYVGHIQLQYGRAGYDVLGECGGREVPALLARTRVLLSQLKEAAEAVGGAGQATTAQGAEGSEEAAENVPCRVCGSTTTDLHYNHVCGNCGLVEQGSEEGEPNRWKLTAAENTDDVIAYFTNEAAARKMYREYDAAGGAVRLLSCYEDEEGDLTEWENEEWNVELHGAAGA